MAVVTIKKWTVDAHVGIEPHELEAPQEIYIDISFEYDDAKPAMSDSIKDAIDYKDMQGRVAGLLKTSRFNLVEKMAHQILDVVMEDRRITRASVTVTKPKALNDCSGVSLKVEKQRKP